MRQAVAPSESVENNSFEVTNLFKICSHCQRLRKKVRERRKGKQTHFPDRTGLKKLRRDNGVACVFGVSQSRCFAATCFFSFSSSLP